MKRFFAILLVLCLILCGCEMGGNTPTEPNTPGQSGGEQTNDPTSGQSGEPTRPVIVEPITADSPALCISVHINPMLELYLNFSYEIVEVKAINEDAEKLLTEQKLIGKSYDEGIAIVLAEAAQQGFLKDRTKVYIGAREIIPGTWMQNSEEMMRTPFENYQMDSGMTLDCEFTPGGKSTPAIHSTHTNEREDFTEVICYEATGMQILTKLFYDNGDYCEINYYTGITYWWYADGRYSCHYLKDGLQEWYVLHPDGRVDWVKAKPDETGQRYAWYLEINDNGSSWEYFTENGNVVKDIYVGADGFSSETSYIYENGDLVREMTRHSDGSSNEAQFFYENGEMVRLLGTYSDGTTREDFYENGQLVRSVITYTDGSTGEEFYENEQLVRAVISNVDGSTQEQFYENEQLVRIVFTNADGSTWEESYGDGGTTGTNSDGSTFEQTFYPNGNLKTYNTTWPNGDYSKQNYYENGNMKTDIQFRDGGYVELYYDENGLLISVFQREPDGTEYDWDYENGEAVGYTVTYPDGSIQVMSFGNGASAGTNPDGSTYEETRYPNGNLETYTTTWPNGDYQKLTYYENGNMETDEAFQNGSYRVNYYDENGMPTSFFQRNSDGSECQYEYQNGNIKTSTITWPNSDYEQYTYYENGVFATQIGQSDGNYFENYYDENGVRTASFERHADGTEYDWDYENGEAVGYTVTYPDGSSEYHSYSP